MGGLLPEPPRARRQAVQHLVVLVPGIGGSTLWRGDQLLWGIGPGVVRRPVRLMDALVPVGGDLADPEYIDGVEARRLIGVPVPGLTRLLGYGALRRRLTEQFDLHGESNYLEFPYDWRRPISMNAQLLGEAVRFRLQHMREHVNPNAEVIIVGHSMGGLVAREYLEHGSGHEVCRRLITLGSPYRGSVKALDFLVNGPAVKSLRLRSLAEQLRRLPSLYELLPIYPVISDDRDPSSPLRRVENVVDALPGVDTYRIRAARTFVRALNDSERPTVTDPVAGFGPPTLQHAALTSGGLRVTRSAARLPTNYGLAGGDGTVPLIAARPLSHTEGRHLTVRYDNQSHAGMVAAEASIELLARAISDELQDYDPVRLASDREDSPPDDNAPRQLPTVTIDVDDLYAAGEPVRVAGAVRNWPTGRDLLARVGSGGQESLIPLMADNSFEINLGLLEQGLHRIDLLTAPSGRVTLSDSIEVA